MPAPRPPAVAYNSRGSAYNDLGQYEKAMQDFDEAIRLDPLKRRRLKLRGLVYHTIGKSEEAVRDRAKAKELGIP